MTAFHTAPGDRHSTAHPLYPAPPSLTNPAPASSAIPESPLILQHPDRTPLHPLHPLPTLHPPVDFFQAAIAQAGIAIVSLDTTGIITTFNQAATHFFACSENQAMGQPMDSLIPPEYRTVAAGALQRTLQQHSVNHYEMAFVPPGGNHPLHVGVTLSCVLDNNNQCLGVVAWVRDITNRKELETNLLRTRHMAALGTLAEGVAHHFNNIVCGMHTMVDFALTTEDPATMTRALHLSAEAATRISYITQSLLGLNCPEGEPASAVPADLTAELRRFSNAVEPGLAKKGIVLQLELQAQRNAAVPRHRFAQALQHLLRNAEESFRGMSPHQTKRITIRTMSQQDQIMLQFSDTGMGIAPEHLPQIFDPFFTTKGVQSGGHESNPGLGLTFVHALIMDLNGHVWADSVLGQGATINMLIPATT